MSKVIIHLGANKTGSTTLQRCLFAQNSELAYLGEDCLGYDKYMDVLNSMVSDDDIYFNFEAAKNIFDKVLGTSSGKTAIYSNEDIMASRIPVKCAERLHQLLPDAEILVVIRNQLTAIPSWYANHGAFLKLVPRSHWKRHVPFDDWMQYCTEFIKYSPLDSFFYHRILGLYADLFGKDKIKILFFEDFVKDKKRFMTELCDILGINTDHAVELVGNNRERKCFTGRTLNYNKFRNWFFWNRSISNYLPFGKTLKRSLFSYLEKGKPVDGVMSDKWKDRIVELYKEDNTKLAMEYDLPLAEYGYPIEKEQRQ